MSKTWDQRQKEFLESRLVDVGQKLVWVRGGAAQGMMDDPLEVVWFKEAKKHNWYVLDKEGDLHCVLPSRLFTVWQMQDWMESHRNEVPPPEIKELVDVQRRRHARHY